MFIVYQDQVPSHVGHRKKTFSRDGRASVIVRLLQDVPWWRESSSMSVAAMSVSLN